MVADAPLTYVIVIVVLTILVALLFIVRDKYSKLRSKHNQPKRIKNELMFHRDMIWLMRKIPMTLYIVRAKPKNDLSGLRKELESGKISKLRPFGETLHHGLKNARFDTSNNYVMWVEEDYCSPPLAMERESVLDKYFDDITVERVSSQKEDGKALTISHYFGVNDTAP